MYVYILDIISNFIFKMKNRNREKLLVKHFVEFKFRPLQTPTFEFIYSILYMKFLYRSKFRFFSFVSITVAASRSPFFLILYAKWGWRMPSFVFSQLAALTQRTAEDTIFNCALGRNLSKLRQNGERGDGTEIPDIVYAVYRQRGNCYLLLLLVHSVVITKRRRSLREKNKDVRRSSFKLKSTLMKEVLIETSNPIEKHFIPKYS